MTSHPVIWPWSNCDTSHDVVFMTSHKRHVADITCQPMTSPADYNVDVRRHGHVTEGEVTEVGGNWITSPSRDWWCGRPGVRTEGRRSRQKGPELPWFGRIYLPVLLLVLTWCQTCPGAALSDPCCTAAGVPLSVAPRNLYSPHHFPYRRPDLEVGSPLGSIVATTA